MQFLNSNIEGESLTVHFHSVLFPLEIRNSMFNNIFFISANPIKNSISFFNCTFINIKTLELMKNSIKAGYEIEEEILFKNSKFHMDHTSFFFGKYEFNETTRQISFEDNFFYEPYVC